MHTLTFLPFWAEFCCGVLLFTSLLARAQKRTYQRNVCLCLIIVLGSLSILVNHSLLSNNPIWFSSLFALMLYSLNSLDPKLSSLKSIQWLKFFGIMSYSLYLLHTPFQGKVIYLGLKFISIDSRMMLCLQLFGWIVAILVSYIFYLLVEKPLNDWRYRQKNSA